MLFKIFSYSLQHKLHQIKNCMCQRHKTNTQRTSAYYHNMMTNLEADEQSKWQWFQDQTELGLTIYLVCHLLGQEVAGEDLLLGTRANQHVHSHNSLFLSSHPSLSISNHSTVSSAANKLQHCQKHSTFSANVTCISLQCHVTAQCDSLMLYKTR